MQVYHVATPWQWSYSGDEHNSNGTEERNLSDIDVNPLNYPLPPKIDLYVNEPDQTCLVVSIRNEFSDFIFRQINAFKVFDGFPYYFSGRFFIHDIIDFICYS